MRRLIKFFILGRRMIITASITLLLAAGFFAYAAFIEPTFAPGDSDQDWSENVMGANNADNDFNSSLVAANADGSLVERLEYVQAYCLGDCPASYAYGDDNAWYVLGTADAPGLGMKDTWSGSSTTYVYPQSVGGVDDCNYTGSACGSYPTESYGSSTPWTQCTSANDYCGTNDETACTGDVCWRDDSTGLVWSDWLGAGSTYDWFWANSCLDDSLIGDGACGTHGEVACQCVKQTAGNETGCEDLGDGNWRLPDQKEYMLAYVNGMQKHIPNTSSGATIYSFWSATTRSLSTGYAWAVFLAHGTVSSLNKTLTFRARCVR